MSAKYETKTLTLYRIFASGLNETFQVSGSSTKTELTSFKTWVIDFYSKKIVY
jgi:hypothetical protein